MKLAGSYAFTAPQEQVWAMLRNPVTFAEAVPDCQNLRWVHDNRFAGTLHIHAGLFQSKVTGTLTLTPGQTARADPFQRLEPVVAGQNAITDAQFLDGDLAALGGDQGTFGQTGHWIYSLLVGNQRDQRPAAGRYDRTSIAPMKTEMPARPIMSTDMPKTVETFAMVAPTQRVTSEVM